MRPPFLCLEPSRFCAAKGDDPATGPLVSFLPSLRFSTMICSIRFRPLAALAVCLIGSAAQADLFPDKNLEAAVRQQVLAKRDKPEPLVAEDVANVSTVVGKGKAIKSLAGLEACKALASLELDNNEIADLAPLAQLKSLQLLSLANNKIASIAPLAELATLQYLNLSGNEVADLAPLAKLVSLNSLYLGKNKIADVTPVAGLKKLWSLYIDENQIADIKPLAALTGLSTFSAKGNQIADLAPLAEMKVRNLYFLDNNKIVDLAPLVALAKADAEQGKSLTPFWRIWLSGNPLSEAAKNEQVPALKQLGAKVELEPPAAGK